MKKLLIILLIFTAAHAHGQNLPPDEQVYTYILEGTQGDFGKGEYRQGSTERVPKGHCTESGNVRTDKDLGIQRKKGVLFEYSLATGKPTRFFYGYTQNDGDRYRIYVSSKTIYYDIGDTTKVKLATCTATGSWTAQTVNDNLYLYSDDSTNDSLEWDGTTLTRFTSPDIRYSAKWNEVVWGAGDPNAPSFLYRCHIDTEGVTFPKQWVTDKGVSYIDFIGEGDGSKIEWLQTFKRNLQILKTRSTYMAYGVIPAHNIVINDSVIGCLSGYGVQQYQGNLIIPSHRGIESYDGYDYTLKSRHIQETIDDITQLQGDSYANTFNDTTASDFGAGTLIHVDSTTTPGSIQTKFIDQSATHTSGILFRGLYQGQLSQSFRPKYTSKCNLIKVQLVSVGTGSDHTVWIRQATNNGTILSTATIIGIDVLTNAPATVSYDLNFSPTVQLTEETTYFLYIDEGGTVDNGIGWGYLPNDYPRGALYQDGSVWGTGVDAGFAQYTIGKSTFISQVHDMGINVISLGVPIINDSGTTSIATYSIATSSYATGGFDTYTIIINGVDINKSAERYAKYGIVYDKDSSTQTASLQDITVVYYSKDPATRIASIVIDQRWYMAYMSLSANINDSVLIMDKDGSFYHDSGAYGSMGLYRNKPYAGSAADDGNIFRLEATGIYTDSGTATTAFYVTPDMTFDRPTIKKIYDEVYIVLNEITDGILTLSYYIDGSTTAVKDWSINMAKEPNVCREGIGFTIGMHGYTIRYKLSSTDNFNVRRIETKYRLIDQRK